MIKLKKN